MNTPATRPLHPADPGVPTLFREVRSWEPGGIEDRV